MRFPELRVPGPQRAIQLRRWADEIDVSIRGRCSKTSREYTEELRKKTPELGIVDADTTLRLDRPELRVRIDRERSADLDVDTQDIATALRLLVGGDDEVTRYRDRAINDDYDVQLRLSEADRNDLDNRPAPGARAMVGWSGSTTWCRSSRPPARRASIGWTGSATGVSSRQRRAWLRPGRPTAGDSRPRRE